MTDKMRTTVAACGLVGLLTVATAAPVLAQAVYNGPYGAYAAPYGAYPAYRAYRSWDYPAGYDTGGAAYYWRELGWQAGPPSTAPANPCTPSQREQNRC